MTTTTSEWAGEGEDTFERSLKGIGRSALLGTLVGFVIVFTISTGAVLSTGESVVGSIGTGLFTAAWGGPGFGGMLGATLHLARAMSTAAAAEPVVAAAPATVPAEPAEHAAGSVLAGAHS